MDFSQTRMGQIFFSGQLPKLINNLERIANAMEKSNTLKEKELKLLAENSHKKGNTDEAK